MAGESAPKTDARPCKRPLRPLERAFVVSDLQSDFSVHILPGAMTARKTKTVCVPPRRYKVQRRVDIYARDLSDRRFLFCVTWRTVNEVDRKATAERIFMNMRREDSAHEFRMVEEWPFGTEVRVLK